MSYGKGLYVNIEVGPLNRFECLSAVFLECVSGMDKLM